MTQLVTDQRKPKRTLLQRIASLLGSERVGESEIHSWFNDFAAALETHKANVVNVLSSMAAEIEEEGVRGRQDIRLCIEDEERRILVSASDTMRLWSKEGVEDFKKQVQKDFINEMRALREKSTERLEELRQRQQKEIERQFEQFQRTLEAQTSRLMETWPEKIRELSEFVKRFTDEDKLRIISEGEKLEKEATDTVAEFQKRVEDLKRHSAEVSNEEVQKLTSQVQNELAPFREEILETARREFKTVQDKVDTDFSTMLSELNTLETSYRAAIAEAKMKFDQKLSALEKAIAETTEEETERIDALKHEAQSAVEELRQKLYEAQLQTAALERHVEELKAAAPPEEALTAPPPETSRSTKTEASNASTAQASKPELEIPVAPAAETPTRVEKSKIAEELSVPAAPTTTQRAEDLIAGMKKTTRTAEKSLEEKAPAPALPNPQRDKVLKTLERNPWVTVSDSSLGTVQVYVAPELMGTRKLYCGVCAPEPPCKHIEKVEKYLRASGVVE